MDCPVVSGYTNKVLPNIGRRRQGQERGSPWTVLFKSVIHHYLIRIHKKFTTVRRHVCPGVSEFQAKPVFKSIRGVSQSGRETEGIIFQTKRRIGYYRVL